MKKYLMVVGMLLGAANASGLGSVTLPEKHALRERLCQKGFEPLVDRTNLVTDLAGRKKKVEGVIVAVDTALGEYVKHSSGPNKSVIYGAMCMKRLPLIVAIFQKYPEAQRRALEMLNAEQLLSKL